MIKNVFNTNKKLKNFYNILLLALNALNIENYFSSKLF